MRPVEVYLVNLRSSKGKELAVSFVGSTRGQVLYAAMEMYPDYSIVRVHREGQWDDPADWAPADHAQAW